MNAALVKTFIDRVWNDGDVAAAADFVASAYTIHHDPGDPWEGMTLDLQGFMERVRQSRAPVPDQRFELQDVLENDIGVAMTWLWQGTHLGDIAGFPPTGQTIRMSGATVYYVDNGRITGHWQVADRLSVYRQLQQSAAT